MTISFKQFATYIAAPADASPAQLDEIWERIFGKKVDKENEDGKDNANKSNARVMTKKDLDDKRKEIAIKRKKELEAKRNQAWAASKDRTELSRKDGKGEHRNDIVWHDSHNVNMGQLSKMRESMPLTERTNRRTFRGFDDWAAAAKALTLDKADVVFLKNYKSDSKMDANLASPDGIIIAKWSPSRGEGWTKFMLKEGKEAYSQEEYWKDDAKVAGYKIKKLSGNLMSGDQTWGAFKEDKKMGEFSETEDKRSGWLIH